MKDIEAAIADAGAQMWLLPAQHGEAQRLVRSTPLARLGEPGLVSPAW